MRIAVIGAGIAGNTAAYSLACAPHVSEIVVYEKDHRPGGHSATVDIDYDGQAIAVDTGFIVYNTLNYPNLTALFEHLGVPTKASDMSFALSLDGGAFEWTGRREDMWDGLFAQRRNLANPRFLGMLMEILRFQRQCIGDRANGFAKGLTLGQYLEARKFSNVLRDRYVVPMGAAIWSMPLKDLLSFPAENFIAFFENHRLLQREQPMWRTVEGGSRTYVTLLQKRFREALRLNCPVTSVTRDAMGVTVRDATGGSERFDHAIIAAHSDEALAMLADPSDQEHALLSAIRFRPNDVYLHRDVSLMPKRRKAWAAWNVLSQRNAPPGDLCVSYSMNHLQGIDRNRPLFVTLNPVVPPAAELTFARFSYAHPQYDQAAFDAQLQLDAIQNQRRTLFCGAWQGYGFHEDGLVAGMLAAEKLGAYLPWRTSGTTRALAAE
jgi:predicted NAD/FAD-binding protein